MDGFRSVFAADVGQEYLPLVVEELPEANLVSLADRGKLD